MDIGRGAQRGPSINHLEMELHIISVEGWHTRGITNSLQGP